MKKTTLILLAALAGCGTTQAGSNGPLIVVRMLEPDLQIVAISTGAPPDPANTCADGSVRAVFQPATDADVLIPDRLGKATFEITYADGDGLRFVDLQISLDEAGVISPDGGEEFPGIFHAPKFEPGDTTSIKAIVTPLTGPSDFVTLEIGGSDLMDNATQLDVRVALARRVCP